MHVVAVLMLQGAISQAPALPSPQFFDLRTARSPRSTSLSLSPRCSASDTPDEIVVCGARTDRYRLPLPSDDRDTTRRVPGEARSGLDALAPPARCGTFAGERSCGKAEASAYGYGNGRDPVTVAGKLLTNILDPDAN